MAYNSISIFYLCPKCLEPAEEASPCPRCGGERIRCRPGEPDDPCRKPLMSAAGQLKGRAPLWWLQGSAGQLPEVKNSLKRQ